jgi:hypothetical protein
MCPFHLKALLSTTNLVHFQKVDTPSSTRKRTTDGLCILNAHVSVEAPIDQNVILVPPFCISQLCINEKLVSL